jgi:hypothetical protein
VPAMRLRIVLPRLLRIMISPGLRAGYAAQAWAGSLSRSK